MKWAGAVLIMTAAVYLGRQLSARKKESIRFLEGMLRYCRLLSQEILCQRLLFAQACVQAALRADPAFLAFAEELSKRLDQKEPPATVWKALLHQHFDLISLSEQEWELLELAGDAFSAPHSDMIRSQEAAVQESLEECLKLRRQTCEQDRRLCTGLSILFGLFCVLLLI